MSGTEGLEKPLKVWAASGCFHLGLCFLNSSKSAELEGRRLCSEPHTFTKHLLSTGCMQRRHRGCHSMGGLQTSDQVRALRTREFGVTNSATRGMEDELS